MNEQPEKDEFARIESALSNIFHRTTPDPQFVKHLDLLLRAQTPTLGGRYPARPTLLLRLGLTRNSLVVGFAITVMVLVMIWAFSRLIPHPTSGALSTQAANEVSSTETTTSPPRITPVSKEVNSGLDPLTIHSSSDEIRQRMLISHTLWHSLWVDGIVANYPGNISIEGTQSSRTQVWITQPAQVRVLTGPPDGNPSYLWISDGEKLRNGEEVPLHIRQWQNETWKQEIEVIYPHPLTGFLPTPLADLLLPSGFAQREGDIRVINVETIANRQALVIEWTLPGGRKVDRLWIDTQTGIIIRQQHYGKEGDGALTSEITLLDIVFDPDLPPETFDRLAAFPPVFASRPDEIYALKLDKAIPDKTQTETPHLDSNSETSLKMGEIYLLLDKNGYTTAGLAHFPAACLIDNHPCPRAELVSDFPNDEIGEWPLRWSPDGHQLVVSSYESLQQVLIFDRRNQTWQALDAPFFSGALWSPDGQWLIGQPVIYGDASSNPLLLARADGQEWHYLLQDEQGFKSPLGWLDENKIVFIQTLDNVEPSFHARIQILDLKNGDLTLLQDIFYEEGLNGPVLKPDGSQLAYGVDRSDPYVINMIDVTDGSVTTLETPVSGSLDWSPDGEYLAFTAGLGYSCEIHILRLSNQESRKIFTGDWGGACTYTWSPSGDYILVGAYAQNPTIPRLDIISVSTGETRLIELPDLGVEFEWPRPSWVP